jgi:hypothetical protein
MPKLVVNGAQLKCSMGAAPSSLTVLPSRQSDGDSQPLATVQDYQPMVNIATSPWTPGSTTVTVSDEKALTDDSKCNCQWAGMIEITSPGANTLEVD